MKQQLSKVYNILICLLIASIVLADLFKAIPNIILGVLAVLLPFIIEKNKVKKLNSYIFFYFSFLLVLVFLLLLQENFLQDLKYIKGFFLVPLIIIITYAASSKYIGLFKSSFILPLMGIASFMATRICYSYLTDASFSFTNGEIVYEYIIGERIYLGFYTAIGSYLAYDLFKEKFHLRWIWLACSLFLLFFILLISSRIGLIVWSVFVVYEVFKALKSGQLKWYYFAGFCTISFLALINTDIYDRLTYQNQYNEPFLVGLMEFEPRAEIWPCVIESINNSNILLGQGFDNAQESLVSCYSKIEKPEKADWFILRRYNSHNQYLNVLAGSGVISLLSFLSAIFLLLWHYKKTKYIAVLIGAFLFLLIENAIFRQPGYYIVSVILLLASLEKHSKNALI